MGQLIKQMPYLVIVSIVLVVAVVSLITNNQPNLQGALVITPNDQTVLGCIDSDPENKPWKKGEVQVGNIKYHDSCFQNTLKQYECGKDQRALLIRDFICANGCENGKCR